MPFQKGHPFYKGGEKGWFKKGHPKPKNAYKWPKGTMPHNVGKKGYTNKGSFKKGNIPLAPFKKGHIPWFKIHPELIPRGKNHPMWKNGKTTGSDGSILIKKSEHPFCNKSGYILEHRLIVESQIGRYLKPKEVVHHLNKTRDDNHPKNLMAFINDSVHKRFHKDPNSVKPEEIIFDGRKL